MAPKRRSSGFFKGKNWFCWDVGPVLRRRTTFFEKNYAHSELLCRNVKLWLCTWFVVKKCFEKFFL